MTEKYDISTQPANSLLRDLKSLIGIVVPLVRQLMTPSPLSTGLSDLPIVTFPQHSPPLRFGLCWYRVELSALNYRIDQIAPSELLRTKTRSDSQLCHRWCHNRAVQPFNYRLSSDD